MSVSKAADIPGGWVSILQESDADLARGEIVPLSAILSELQATVEKIETELAASSAGVPEES